MCGASLCVIFLMTLLIQNKAMAETMNTKIHELVHNPEKSSKYPNKIGVISLNTFSRPYSKEAEALRAKVKVLSIQKNGKMYTADAPNLRTMSYPFTRVLYFLKSDGAFTMANGFIRYSCTQLGQIIVEKEGLQKYNLYERQVQMH